MNNESVMGYLETPRGKILLRRMNGKLAWYSERPELKELAGELVDLSADISEPDGNPYAAAIHKLSAYLPGLSRVVWQPPDDSNEDARMKYQEQGQPERHTLAAQMEAVVERYTTNQEPQRPR